MLQFEQQPVFNNKDSGITHEIASQASIEVIIIWHTLNLLSHALTNHNIAKLSTSINLTTTPGCL
jgi:hypothetical protein